MLPKHLVMVRLIQLLDVMKKFVVLPVFYQERQNVSFYQKEIEELNLSLKKIKADFKDYIDNTNNEKNENEKIYNKLLEEKKNLIKRINELQIELEYLRGDYENKIRSL